MFLRRVALAKSARTTTNISPCIPARYIYHYQYKLTRQFSHRLPTLQKEDGLNIQTKDVSENSSGASDRSVDEKKLESQVETKSASDTHEISQDPEGKDGKVGGFDDLELGLLDTLEVETPKTSEPTKDQSDKIEDVKFDFVANDNAEPQLDNGFDSIANNTDLFSDPDWQLNDKPRQTGSDKPFDYLKGLTIQLPSSDYDINLYQEGPKLVDTSKRIFLKQDDIYGRRKGNRLAPKFKVSYLRKTQEGAPKPAPKPFRSDKTKEDLAKAIFEKKLYAKASVKAINKQVAERGEKEPKEEKEEVNVDQLVAAIDSFNPSVDMISKGKHRGIVMELDKGFTKHQIYAYICKFSTRLERRNWGTYLISKKGVLIDTIIKTLWKIEIDPNLKIELFDSKRIKLSPKDYYLMQRSKLETELNQHKLKVSFKDGKFIDVEGAKDKLAVIEPTVESTRGRFITKLVDLSYLHQRFEQLGYRLPIEKLQDVTGCYVQQISATSHEITANSMADINLFQKLAQSLPELNPHVKTNIFKSDSLALREYEPFELTERFSWFDKLYTFFQPRKPTKQDSENIFMYMLQKLQGKLYPDDPNVALRRDINDVLNLKSLELTKTEEKGLNWLDLNSSKQEDDSSEGPDLYLKIFDSESPIEKTSTTDQAVQAEVKEALKDIGLVSELSDESSQGEPKPLVTEPNKNIGDQDIASQNKNDTLSFVDDLIEQQTETKPRISLQDYFTEEQLDQLYYQINDLSYTNSLHGVDKILSSAITINFGSILLRQKKSTDFFPMTPKPISKLAYQFLPSNNLIRDYITSLPEWLNPRTLIELTFEPYIYDSETLQADIIDKSKYPPVVIQLEKDKGALNIAHAVVASVESLKKVMIPLNNEICDLQISRIVAGDLLETDNDKGRQIIRPSTEPIPEAAPEQESQPQEVPEEELYEQDELGATFARFRNQPGISEFFAKSNFTGEGKMYIKPQAKFYIGDEEVVYNHVSMSIRTELPFMYNGKPFTLKIIEGGTYGGRRVEVEFGQGQITRQEFDSFMTDILQLVQDAS